MLDTPDGKAGQPIAPTAAAEIAPTLAHLVRWLVPFVQRNAEDFNTT
ncbi:MAG: hypothetical protein Q8R98_07815 [Rubrivivax sp.]|nr:hypothetical protein [Rubrivivax sp.]MDZ4054376.1 hypothetical protein [Phenylobacterium sp.]